MGRNTCSRSGGNCELNSMMIQSSRSTLAGSETSHAGLLGVPEERIDDNRLYRGWINCCRTKKHSKSI